MSEFTTSRSSPAGGAPGGAAIDEAAILRLERPHPRLWNYYLLKCLAFPPAFPFLVLPAWFRYTTMRYTFTDEGISMRWGILFRKEIIIHYARIQDIHLRSNIAERWLGLARVLIQTASGNAGAEMTYVVSSSSSSLFLFFL